jgi:hypothetical protein
MVQIRPGRTETCDQQTGHRRPTGADEGRESGLYPQAWVDRLELTQVLQSHIAAENARQDGGKNSRRLPVLGGRKGRLVASWSVWFGC